MKKLIALIFGLVCMLSPLPSSASLTFTNASTDVINFGTLNSYAMTPVTVMVWIKPNSFTAPRRIWAKQGASTFIICQTMNTGTGNIRCRTSQSTPTTYDTSNCYNTTGGWLFLAFTYDQTASAGNLWHIYQKLPNGVLSECSYSAQTDGSGTGGDYSANDFTVGNSASAATQAPDATIASVMVVNRVMSLGEIRAQQARFFNVQGSLVLSLFGYTGTATQPDWSGNKFTGTVTGTKLAPNPPLGFPFLFQ